MKKFLLFVLIMSMFLIPDFSWAVPNSVVSIGSPQNFVINGVKSVKVVTVTWTADTVDGTITSQTFPILAYGLQGWRLFSAETDPGSPAPTIYAVTLKDSHGFDTLGGKLATCSATVTELWYMLTATTGLPIMYENLTLAIVQTATATNAAQGVLILTFVPINK